MDAHSQQVIVGIDEAGYAPTLGPMLVSAVALAVPKGWQADALWDKLAPTIHRPGSGRAPAGSVTVGDSKAIYSPDAGLKRLETSVLAFSLLAGVPIGSLRQLLLRLALAPAELLEEMDTYPWYDGEDLLLPVEADLAAIEGSAAQLRVGLAGASVELLGVRCIPLMVSEYNAQVGKVDNKATVLFGQSARLMRWAIDGCPDARLHILADKQGGRNAYEMLLGETFEGALMSTLRESLDESTYLLRLRDQTIAVDFTVRGDAVYMPVALASMFSKYVRELFMLLFNRFWQRHLPRLQPTSGYPVDARRFIAEIADVQQRLAIRDSALIRIR
jgi:ribonuclease HII